MFGSLKTILTSSWYKNKDNYIIGMSTPKENTMWQIFSAYTIPKEDSELFKKTMEAKYKIARFYDINLFKGINDDLKFEEVLETSDKVKITLNIPTTLSKVEDGYKRTYYVIRLHNGKTDILDVTLTDDNKVSFETDKFSSYALAYTDEKIENTNTSDKALIYGVISLIGLSEIIYTARVLKKRD